LGKWIKFKAIFGDTFCIEIFFNLVDDGDDIFCSDEIGRSASDVDSFDFLSGEFTAVVFDFFLELF
jgi:hypothetical protein